MAKINARAKGHAYERKIAHLFQELGWADCCSSRSENRRLDACGVDLCHTDPFYIQAKAVEKLGSYHDILARMPEMKDKFNLIFHKRNHKGTIVAMSEEDFFAILELLVKARVINPA